MNAFQAEALAGSLVHHVHLGEIQGRAADAAEEALACLDPFAAPIPVDVAARASP
jgi:hypothetical protein